jgi:hypothetical protein
MVWIHGDEAIGGGGFFDARPLAVAGDVVVVTVNYRLGIFGAFGHPGLEGSGTFGLQDQQAALGWVRRNAAAFGGDPGNVTVFGESYGGLSVSAHLLSPGSRGLFDRAIDQSGFALMDLPAGAMFPGLPAVPWYGWRSTAEVETLGAAVASRLGLAEAFGDHAGSVQALSPVGLDVAGRGPGHGAHRPHVGPFDLRPAPAPGRARADLRLRVRRPAGAHVPSLPA